MRLSNKNNNIAWLDQTRTITIIVTTMIIHTWNKNLDMKANKLNAKYHLHAQHTTNTKTLR